MVLDLYQITSTASAENPEVVGVTTDGSKNSKAFLAAFLVPAGFLFIAYLLVLVLWCRRKLYRYSLSNTYFLRILQILNMQSTRSKYTCLCFIFFFVLIKRCQTNHKTEMSILVLIHSNFTKFNILIFGFVLGFAKVY